MYHRRFLALGLPFVSAFSSLIFLTACAPTPVPITVQTTIPVSVKRVEAEKILNTLISNPIAAGQNVEDPMKPVFMPKGGELNSYGVKVSSEFAVAYEAYLKGNGKASLAAIDQAERAIAPTDANANRIKWNLSVLRVQNFIAQGLAAEADAELTRTEKLEQLVFGSTLFSRALKGEALVWLGDYETAVKELTLVAMSVETYRLPTSYSAPPTNVPELFYYSTAQLRAYTSLSAQYLLREKFDEALKWSERAETLYADVFFVAGHFLYGRYMTVHADSYYGRALNLSFLGAATAIIKNDLAAGLAIIDRADTIYAAIGYQPGKVSNQALRAYAALKSGNLDAADKAAAEAVKMAKKSGLADFVWRVDALRGEALLADNQPKKAEAAFRRAEDAIGAITGSLSSDRAKRRFGVGKSDITYRLSQFDIANGDVAQLFADLERGRARAFVDMVAHIPIAGSENSSASLGSQIRDIDLEIRRLRSVAASSGANIRDAVRPLLDQRTQLITQMRAVSPDRANLYGVENVDLKEIQTALPKGTLLVQGIPLREDERVQLLLVTSKSAQVLRTDATLEDFEDTLEDLTDAIALGEANSQREAAQSLDDILGVSKWPASEQVLIVPTGPMFFVPWGALSLDVPVSVLPNAGWIKRTADVDWKIDKAVVLGDPDFGGAMPQLPGAGREASAVASLYGVNLITDRAATELATRQAVGNGVDILHLATHGKFEASYPLRSAIFLANDAGPAQPLTAEELFKSPLPARLVVLSACETGIGKAEAGDDFLGLARSFNLGGAVAVLNSLWPVNDKGTEVFMRAFHENLSKGPGAAWLAARNATRDAGFPIYVYSAFVLGGSVSR
jgi:hypothetical protein